MPIDFDRIARSCRVRPGSHVRLRDFDPADTCVPEFAGLDSSSVKARADAVLEANRAAKPGSSDVTPNAMGSDSNWVLTPRLSMNSSAASELQGGSRNPPIARYPVLSNHWPTTPPRKWLCTSIRSPDTDTSGNPG